jgi:hypothetical protein
MEDKNIPQRGVRCVMIKALWYRGPDILIYEYENNAGLH